MGIESDQVVYEYLSRVGDVAQQRQLPSGTRMRLVSELRNEIDRRRAKATVDSPAAVRRILERLGSPESVVSAANAGGGEGGGSGGRAEPRAAVPVQRAQEPESRSKRLRRVVPRPRPAEPDVPEPADSAPSPPHLASAEELGSGQPDWWRVGGGSPFGAMDSVPGFTGGIEIPDLLKPPSEKPEGPEKPADPEDPGGKDERNPKSAVPGAVPKAPVEAAEADAAAGTADTKTRRFVPRLRPIGGGWTNPLLLLAAALLVAGAVIGNLVMLGLGWLIAYLSRRLSPSESKLAVLGLPGLAVTAGLVWIWGRTERRWGAPIADGHMSAAVAETWPWVLRVAAFASALYLVWRSQRPRS
ncbi:hypothetical protein [Streptomyces sp. NBC_00878]|uniref:hypothetical protein n=1 Tax=Streptomyces sp. NBC_00878 TaxID=2975854 RepID=UPI0022546394|nr:hypothetical protein [Streptomyces sp. NBC_00878]MCX4906559.1 hypothetical protein [Streptomyces sp. NBC_00878]